MTHIQEEWKPVVGFEGVYDISSLGSVRRTKKGMGAKVGKVIKPISPCDDYLRVFLREHGARYRRAIHHLVLEAFVGPRPTHMVINHINGVKHDNRLENLEYVTLSENSKRAIRMGLAKPPKPPSVHKDFHTCCQQGLSEAAWCLGLAIAASLLGVDLKDIKI